MFSWTLGKVPMQQCLTFEVDMKKKLRWMTNIKADATHAVSTFFSFTFPLQHSSRVQDDWFFAWLYPTAYLHEFWHFNLVRALFVFSKIFIFCAASQCEKPLLLSFLGICFLSMRARVKTQKKITFSRFMTTTLHKLNTNIKFFRLHFFMCVMYMYIFLLCAH